MQQLFVPTKYFNLQLQVLNLSIYVQTPYDMLSNFAGSNYHGDYVKNIK